MAKAGVTVSPLGNEEIERSAGDKQIGSKDYDIDRKLSNPSHAKVKKTAKDQSSRSHSFVNLDDQSAFPETPMSSPPQNAFTSLSFPNAVSESDIKPFGRVG